MILVDPVATFSQFSRRGLPRHSEANIDTQERLRLLVEAALEKKAQDVVVLDLAGRVSYCDYFVLASGNNPRHASAIGKGVLETMKLKHGVRPLGDEGLASGKWVLLDYGDVIMHIFTEPMRGYYDLDGLWMDVTRVPLASLGVQAEEAEQAAAPL